VSDEWDEWGERMRVGARKTRYCNCIPPSDADRRRGVGDSWHLHGTRPSCPAVPPTQERCSISLASIGSCHCPRHRDEYTDA
jgi:hypothetical protein